MKSFKIAPSCINTAILVILQATDASLDQVFGNTPKDFPRCFFYLFNVHKILAFQSGCHPQKKKMITITRMFMLVAEGRFKTVACLFFLAFVPHWGGVVRTWPYEFTSRVSSSEREIQRKGLSLWQHDG